MGQKVHPYGFRLGYTKPWKSRWFVERDYDKLLLEDVKLRNELKDKLKSAGVSSIEVERPGNKLRVIIKTARPGIIIGRKGAEIDKLKQEVQKRTSREVFINIQEIQKPELDSQLIAESVAMQLEKRVAFRRAMRKAVESALRFGARGVNGCLHGIADVDRKLAQNGKRNRANAPIGLGLLRCRRSRRRSLGVCIGDRDAAVVLLYPRHLGVVLNDVADFSRKRLADRVHAADRLKHRALERMQRKILQIAPDSRFEYIR
jgi:ribosomal protein S3